MQINRWDVDKLNFEEVIQLIKMGFTRRCKVHKNELLLMVIDSDSNKSLKVFNQSSLFDTNNQNVAMKIKSSCFNF